jgi:hypothetical protein
MSELKKKLNRFNLYTASIVHDFRTPLNCMINM